MRDLFVVLEYSMNYHYISSNLCINRFTPEVMCSGVCYLNEQLAQHKEENKEKPTRNNFELKSTFTVPQIDLDIFFPIAGTNGQVINQVDNFYRSEWFFTLLRPPITFFV